MEGLRSVITVSREGKKVESMFRRNELPLLIGLVITWMALWREVSPMSLISGIIIAIILARVFYLPPVELAASFNIFFVITFLGYFLLQVAISSVQVAWLAIRPKKVPDCSIIEVKLKSRSDFILTATGLTITLIPGSFIVDADRESPTLYLHVLDTSTQEDIDKMRKEVLRIEGLLVRSVGNQEDRLRVLNAN